MFNRHTIKTHWPFLLLLIITLPLLLTRLAQVPYPWYDEGLNLNASRSLATNGLYALPTADELRLSDPAIQTGPPMIIPLAILYKLFGANLTIMRLLTVTFSLAALISLYALANRLYGAFAAFITILLLIIMPGDSSANYIMLSRQVLGEIPAIFFLSLGFHSLMREKRTWQADLVTGLCFGLAVVLKSQVLLVLSVTIAAFSIYRFIQYRPIWQRWTIIVATMVGLYAIDTIWRESMAGDRLADNLSILREGALIHILPMRGLYNLAESGVLVRLAGVLGIGMAFAYARRHWPTPNSLAKQRVEHLITLFCMLWVLWYVLISIGWPRYAFVGQVFTIVLAGAAISWGWKRFRLPQNAVVYGGLVLVCAGAAAVQYLPELRDQRGDNFFATVSYMQEQIPADARIVSWEWPISYFDPQRYIYPQTHDVNMVTARVFVPGYYTPVTFDPLAGCPDYVLLGSFALDREVLAEALKAAESAPIYSAGQYELYRIPPENLERSSDGTCTAK